MQRNVGCSQREAVPTTCGARRSPTPQVLARRTVNQDGLPAEVEKLRSRQSAVGRVPLRDNHRKLLMRGSHVTPVIAQRADELMDRLLAFGDRMEIAHHVSDREVDIEGLACI
jgi:hypothetical protein